MQFFTTIALLAQVSCGLCGIAETWENFWRSSCEYSTMVSRSRRSTPEPNIRNAEELFDYLYPLADVKVEELSSKGRQLNSHPHSLSNWIDDIVDLWQSECHERHKRSLTPQQGEGESGWNMFRRNATSTYDGESIVEEDEESGEDEDEGGTADNKGGKILAAKPTPAAPVTDSDTFFAAYGGDIEYFFPLISFGIPFDGEISLLGFHGFKGLFPYR